MPNTPFLHLFYASLCVVFFTSVSVANDNSPKNNDNNSIQFTITELDWADKRQMTQQVAAIDVIARNTSGRQIHNDKTDLKLLQDLIYKAAITKNDRLNLQGMGVVLGNIMAQEFGLEWRIYEDMKGRNKALCAANTQQCLFPITMLSRRIEVGLLPNIEEIYNNARQLIKPHLKKQSPYSID